MSMFYGQGNWEPMVPNFKEYQEIKITKLGFSPKQVICRVCALIACQHLRDVLTNVNKFSLF